MLERVILACCGLFLVAAGAFTVWLFAFDNGGCPQGQELTVTGYTTITMINNGVVSVMPSPEYACEAAGS